MTADGSGTTDTMLSEALLYASKQWPMVALDRSLVPLDDSPTSDAVEITRRWNRMPNCTPGLVLGHAMGGSKVRLVALIDHGTREANAYLQRRGALDALGLGHLTHGQERAWIFASHTPMASRELAPGLEVRGDGVIPLPPSGDARAEWRWRKGHFLPDRPLAAAPAWLRVAEPDPPRATAAPEVSDDWTEELARTNSGRVLPTLANAATILRCDDRFAGRLAYDEMALAVTLDGKPQSDADVARLRELIERRYGTTLTDATARDAMALVSDGSRVHPVRDYLSRLEWDGISRIARVATDVLHIDKPSALELAMLRCWFIASVARPMRPGCKADTALVLVGAQGAFKSTFFRVLGGEWFSDSHMDITNKDSLMQLASAWIYEWSEIESVTSSRQAGEVKKFITSQFDTFRAPFARTVQRVPRTAVIVGTTNEDRFLNDETGSRRFWALRVRRQIDRALLETWRDRLWAEAVAAWRSGESWWLEAHEESARETHAEAFSVHDPWSHEVETWIRHNEQAEYTTNEVMSGALVLPKKDMHSGSSRRVAAVLRRLGFERVFKRVQREGMTWPPTWVWVRQDATAPPM